jgi:hypothetical protein
MAKSKKDLLAGRQKVGRPSLRREVVTDEEQEAAVVRKVADNPNPPPSTSPAVLLGGVENPAPTTTKKPAASNAEPTAKEPSTRKNAPRKKNNSNADPAADQDKEAFMRMTFDVPKSLHLQLKMHTLKNGVTIKKHMLRIIKKSITD